MSKAAELLALADVEETTEGEETPKAQIDDGEVVDFRLSGSPRKVTAKVAARYLRIVTKQIKSLETVQEAVKDGLRKVGQQALDRELEAGRYFGSAKCGQVLVKRANVYSEVKKYKREDLREAVGAVEYSLLFAETAELRFESIDRLNQQLALLEAAGVPVLGERVEAVKPRKTILQEFVTARSAMAPEVAQLVLKCAKDRKPSVGLAKVA